VRLFRVSTPDDDAAASVCSASWRLPLRVGIRKPLIRQPSKFGIVWELSEKTGSSAVERRRDKRSEVHNAYPSNHNEPVNHGLTCGHSRVGAVTWLQRRKSLAEQCRGTVNGASSSNRLTNSDDAVIEFADGDRTQRFVSAADGSARSDGDKSDNHCTDSDDHNVAARAVSRRAWFPAKSGFGKPRYSGSECCYRARPNPVARWCSRHAFFHNELHHDNWRSGGHANHR
jgi:hypothetical protein